MHAAADACMMLSDAYSCLCVCIYGWVCVCAALKLTCVEVQDLPHLLVSLCLRGKGGVTLLPQELPADDDNDSNKGGGSRDAGHADRDTCDVRPAVTYS